MRATGKYQRQASVGKQEQGFTLIELVIVVAVLGALASIAIPQLTGLQEEAKLNGAATIIASGIKDQFVRDMASSDMDEWDGETYWNGKCSGSGKNGGGYNVGALTGSHGEFEGLDNVEDYQFYSLDKKDNKPNGKYVEIELPKYDKANNQTGSFTCLLGFSSS